MEEHPFVPYTATRNFHHHYLHHQLYTYRHCVHTELFVSTSSWTSSSSSLSLSSSLSFVQKYRELSTTLPTRIIIIIFFFSPQKRGRPVSAILSPRLVIGAPHPPCSTSHRQWHRDVCEFVEVVVCPPEQRWWDWVSMIRTVSLTLSRVAHSRGS